MFSRGEGPPGLSGAGSFAGEDFFEDVEQVDLDADAYFGRRVWPVVGEGGRCCGGSRRDRAALQEADGEGGGHVAGVGAPGGDLRFGFGLVGQVRDGADHEETGLGRRLKRGPGGAAGLHLHADELVPDTASMVTLRLP